MFQFPNFGLAYRARTQMASFILCMTPFPFGFCRPHVKRMLSSPDFAVADS